MKKEPNHKNTKPVYQKPEYYNPEPLMYDNLKDIIVEAFELFPFPKFLEM